MHRHKRILMKRPQLDRQMIGRDPFAEAGHVGHPACRWALLEGNASLADRLTEAERARVSQLKTTRRRAEMEASLVLRRDLIGELTASPPGQVLLDVLPEGAPLLVDPPGYSISIANKRSATVVALDEAPASIGVDVEYVRTIDWRPMLTMLSDEAERAEINATPAFDARAFFRLWTLKEAALKSTKQGFRAGPKSVRVELAAVLAPGAGQLEAFSAIYDYWMVEAGDAVISLVRRRDQVGFRKAIESGLAS